MSTLEKAPLSIILMAVHMEVSTSIAPNGRGFVLTTKRAADL